MRFFVSLFLFFFFFVFNYFWCFWVFVGGRGYCGWSSGILEEVHRFADIWCEIQPPLSRRGECGNSTLHLAGKRTDDPRKDPAHRTARHIRVLQRQNGSPPQERQREVLRQVVKD